MPAPASGLPSRLEVVARSRPFALIAPTAPVASVPVEGGVDAPQPAPYVTVTADLQDARGRVVLTLDSRSVRLSVSYDAPTGRAGLEVDDGAVATTHRSRRRGRLSTPVTLLAHARDRRATEGTTLVRFDGHWLVLASDGRDGRRGQRRGYPVFDLGLDQVGALDAAYPSNLPWPTLAHDGDGWLMVTFDGTPAGGAVLGYGTHGDVVVLRTAGWVSP